MWRNLNEYRIIWYEMEWHGLIGIDRLRHGMVCNDVECFVLGR